MPNPQNEITLNLTNPQHLMLFRLYGEKYNLKTKIDSLNFQLRVVERSIEDKLETLRAQTTEQ